MKNTLNTAKDAAKKQLKNVALASTLIATLASCSGNEKKADSTPTDTTKVETVITKSESATTSDTTTSKNKATPSTATPATQNDENLDDMLKELYALDEQSKAQDSKEAQQKQTPREKRGVTKEERDYAFGVFKQSESFLIDFENEPAEFWQYKKGLDLVKRSIDDYLNMAADLNNQPINPKAQKVINKYKQAIKEYQKN